MVEEPFMKDNLSALKNEIEDLKRFEGKLFKAFQEHFINFL